MLIRTLPVLFHCYRRWRALGGNSWFNFI